MWTSRQTENQSNQSLSNTTKQTDLEARIKRLEDRIETQNHDGLNSVKIELQNIASLFEVVDTIPSNLPNTAYGQIKIYINGTTYRLYVYDQTNDTWHYSTMS